MSKQFNIKWLDRHREPQCKPDPAYPSGKDVDGSAGAKQACTCELPYPAQRCGLYLVSCKLCGISVGVTTAGRPDDPKSIKIGCLMT